VKKWLFAAALYPLLELVVWFGTKFSERWEAALAEFDYEFGLDEHYPLPDPLTVLNRVDDK
jgi:hypothetical protein